MRNLIPTVLAVAMALALAVSSTHAAVVANVNITGAMVTTVRSVDEGFKTFSGASGAFPVNMALNTIGESFMFDAFLLFTDETKVNQEEPNPTGDLTEFLISADVTFSGPASTTLTFTGVTFGQEDFAGVPGLDANGNVVNQALVLAWASTATDEQIALAGGQGVVRWDSGPRFIDVGGGMQLQVTLKDGAYSRAVNFPALLGIKGFGGSGIANAGTVQGNVELIPEPGSAFFLLLSAAGLTFRRARRN